MRLPHTWRDKSLLEDEPFLSAFKARQIAAPPTRRGAALAGEDDDDARNDAIVRDIRDMNLVGLFIVSTSYKQLHRPQLPAVQGWLNLAFQPYYLPHLLNWREIKVDDPGMLCLFVKFYWALSRSFDDAKGILLAARKEQGFGYFLDESEALVSNIDLPKQVHPNKTSQIGDDAFQSLSIKVPGNIPRDFEFQKNHNAKEDAPDCLERERKSSSQTWLPSLDLTSLSLSVTPQIGFNPSSTSPLPPDSRNTTAICDLPKKRKSRQVGPERRNIKNRKFNEATSDTSKLCNLSQNRNDVIDEKTKARPSQLEDINDKADHVSDGALHRQPLKSRIPHGLKFKRKPNAKKGAPDCSEREGKSSQTCPPSLDPTSLSVTRENQINSSVLPSPPDSQDTTDLPKPRKRQTSPDTPRKKHRGINEATSDASKLGENNNLEPHSRECHFEWKEANKLTMVCRPVASSTSESTKIELVETVLFFPSDPPVPEIHDPQRRVEAHPVQGKRKSRSNSRATKKTSVPTPRSKDATLQTTSNPKKRHTSDSDGHQHKREEVPVDQEDSVPVFVQPVLAKKKRGRPPKVREEQEGSASVTVQPAPRKKRGQPQNVKEEQEGSASLSDQLAPRKKKDRPFKSEAQFNAGTVVPFSGRNVDMTRETIITSCIPPPAQSSHAVFGFQETLEGFSCDHWSVVDRSTKEELFNWSCQWTQEHVLAEDFYSEDPAATQMEDNSTNIVPNRRPQLSVNPPIWAQSRQEVCETLDWFRSYQGGVYFAHNAVKGYLLSAFSSKRDRFEHDGKLIISHGGGKSESLHTRKGQTTTQPATDQLAQDKSVRALLDNYRNQRPLVLLIDDKYALFPYDLGVSGMTYVVLGFYAIAHAWAEFQPTTNGNHVVRYKFAFRWCDDQGSPWWLTQKENNFSDLPPPSIPTSFSSEPTSKRKPRKLLNKESENGKGAVLHTTMVREALSHDGPKSYVCRLCHMDSPHVYTWAWLCLHPDCSGFWKDIKGNFPPDNLEYDLDFLKLMTSLPLPADFGKLKPDPPPRLSTEGTVTTYAFTRGFHCNSCGRLSCRVKWERWECSNCEEGLPVSRLPHKAKDFWNITLPINFKDHFINKKSNIKQETVKSFRHENGMGSIQSFILPDGRGKIHHIQPGTPLGRLEADDIFIEYQQQAMAGELKFRRWPLRSHKCRGALLTNYFSQNCGEPYQYVGGTANTVPFENAPGAVVKARALIQKRVQEALGRHLEFNEILSAAYMERQKMAFHSDNEIGLGPVVAGLSLGSPALMHFRINAKYDRLKELKGTLLSFVLRHGDVLVMDGASVQEYYEHTVIPSNFRIAATARYITPGHA